MSRWLPLRSVLLFWFSSLLIPGRFPLKLPPKSDDIDSGYEPPHHFDPFVCVVVAVLDVSRGGLDRLFPGKAFHLRRSRPGSPVARWEMDRPRSDLPGTFSA